MRSAVANPKCIRCKGEGFYYLVPSGVNPFLAGIDALARMMRRVECHCVSEPVKTRQIRKKARK